GGAVGALGTDLSCLNNNPAGIGIYKKSDVTFTAGMQLAKVKSVYNDSLVNDYKNNFVLPNLGIAGAGVNREIDKKNFTRANFAISLNRSVNFKNNISIAGHSKGSSMGLAFSATAQGKNPSQLDQFYELYPYIYDLIDTVNGDPTLYTSTIPEGANMRQEYNAVESGGISDLSIGGGYSYSDKFYGGWAIDVPFINFTRSSAFKESADAILYQCPNLPYKISSFTYNEELNTTGKGINVKFGAIYRFSQYIRAGLAYHSPTAILLKDTYKSTFGITFDSPGGQGGTYTDTSQTAIFRYSLFTPSKVQGSISFLLQKAGSVNIEVESMNYGNMRLKSNPMYFAAIDKFMRQNYKRAFNIKIGVERNIKPVIIRLGYAMFGSPTGNVFAGAGVRHSFAGGAGIRWNNHFIDVSYSLSLRSENFYLYNPLYVNASKMNYSQSFFLVTLGSKI
ncbi:MAG: hypothetical protein IAF38_18725, partial [Bacteroidia bacterium]|nr:hypothetical protein [Bacteroidia bacterium]